jgi:hypothetical protein
LIKEGLMEPKNAAKRTAGRDDRPGNERESPEVVPDETGPGDPEEPEEEGAGVSELDLDDIDAPFDPDFAAAEAWELDTLALDDGVEDDENDNDEPVDDECDDEAEMKLLHELGIDLDAPDGEPGVELELDIAHEDPADDGVAA